MTGHARHESGRKSRVPLIAIGFLVLAVAMTWPLSSPFQTSLPHSDDAYFSVWRISWVAHQLRNDPTALFDANIFYPEKGALAFSDAMLLIGVVAAPFLWLGLDPAMVHNGLLIAALVGSALAATVLARQLGASIWGSLTAGVIFGFAPYRFAHIAHLELQWTVWMPLAMMALHRLAKRPTTLNSTWLGTSVAAQTFSSIYYGVFLTIYLTVAAAIVWAGSRARLRLARSSLFAIVPLLIVVAIYGPPYAYARAENGGRTTEEQERYSATFSDFVRVPESNKLRGHDSGGTAGEERSLYPGAVAAVLAAVALVPPISTPAAMYAGLGLVAFDGSRGTNGILFPTLQRFIPVLSSLRAPTRFGALLLLSIAILAAIGLTRVGTRWPERQTLVALAVVTVCLTEYWSSPLNVRPVDLRPSEVDQFLKYQRPGAVVLELPVPRLDSLWLYETTYQLQSIHHWQPLVNGYSAYFPPTYRRTLEVLEDFPSDASVSHLQKLGVRFIVINRPYYTEEAYAKLMAALSRRPEFWPLQPFRIDSAVIEFKREN